MTEMDPGVREALHAGFMVPEMATWNDDDGKKVEAYMTDVAHAHPEAFRDGLNLKKRAVFVFTADHQSDFERDIEKYDAVVNLLNEKYGKVAIPYSEARESKPLALGIIGHRYCPWGSVTIQNNKGDFSVEFPAETVAMEDEKTRRQ